MTTVEKHGARRSSAPGPERPRPETRLPIRVFHLIKGLGRGGAEMLLSEGLRFADRERFTYGYGYFLPWKDALVESLAAQEAEVTCFGARTNAAILLSVGRIARYLRRWRADVLHCHMPMAGAVGRMAAKVAGIPVVYTEHNRMERFHPWTRRLNLLSWKWQDRVVAVSGDVAASIHAHARRDVPVDVVLNGVSVDRFQPDAAGAAEVRQRLGIPADAPVVGTVAVFRIQKRLDEWLEAARLVRLRYSEARFILVGDGPLRAELEARAAELGLVDVVHFAGLQEAVGPYVSAMDVYMMSSQFEGLPIALLEAMAMERAVVCTAVGGIPEVIDHGENGWLVAAGNPAALADAAATALADPAARLRQGRAARQTVEDRFSMRRMSRELECIYLDVLKDRRNGR